MTESEWKLYRQIHEVALDRFCHRVLAEVSALVADASKSNHERYQTLYGLIKRRDKELAAAFDDMRRSTADRQLAFVRSLGLLTDEEFARFRPETQAGVQEILGG